MSRDEKTDSMKDQSTTIVTEKDIWNVVIFDGLSKLVKPWNHFESYSKTKRQMTFV